MIVYNTTFQISNAVLSKAKEYIIKEFIPECCEDDRVKDPHFRKICGEENNDGASFCVQFQFDSEEIFNQWIEEKGHAIQKKLILEFGTEIIGFSTLMEEILL